MVTVSSPTAQLSNLSLVLHVDVLFRQQRELGKGIGVQVGAVHVHAVDPAVVVRPVVVHPGVRVAA